MCLQRLASTFNNLNQTYFFEHAFPNARIISTNSFNRGCQSCLKNYLTSNSVLRKIRLIVQLKSDWSKHKKPAIIIVNSRICFFRYPQRKFVFHTKCTPQMDPSCRLSTRCLKKDKPLEACNSSGCQNFIHQSCFKKVMSTVADNEWEGLFSTTTKKC